MKRLLPAAVALALAGCGPIGWPWPEGPLLCESDAQCGGTQVCYVDGCGDPGENLAMEVVPQQGAGEAQDFTIEPGNLRPYQVLDLFPAATLGGPVQRYNLLGLQPYSDRVSISVRGGSVLIPGVTRRYDTTSAQTGTYGLQVGTGLYNLYARADDLAIPPLVLRDLFVQPGVALEKIVQLPADADLMHLGGRIVGTLARMDTVPSALEVQVLDAATHEPLSQRVPATTTGEFSVTALFPPSGADTALLQVTAKEPFVPRKLFSIPAADAAILGPLELGDYGAKVTVTGKVLGPAGEPIQDARVALAGPVNGGGWFESAAASSGSDGSFTLQTLASTADAPMTLSIAPPVRTAGGATLAEVVVPLAGGDLGSFTCQERVVLRGQILRPDQSPAARVRVVAEPISALEGGPLPSAPTEINTDDDGQFTLNLDPALYRLDVFPGGDLPKVGRFTAVRAVLDPSSGHFEPIALPAFTLSSGRTLGGRVQMRQTALSATPEPLANATVRIFRVTPVEGVPNSLLLAEGVSDSAGEFQLVIPTR